MSTNREIIILAGPNGAGKTTFAREYLPNEATCPNFVNADLIAAALQPFRPEHAAVRAGRMMLEEINGYVSRDESFAFETTLSGRGYAAKIPHWQQTGYTVRLIFLRLPSVEMAIARVAQRVAEGGHHIEEDVIRRRFTAGRENFDKVYRSLVDSWRLYDNAGVVPALIDTGENT